MNLRWLQNIKRALANRAENWMYAKLQSTKLTWTRQMQWGFRIFDFYNPLLGIAVEVDGNTHDPTWDRVRDRQNYQNQGVLVLRVQNFNEKQAEIVLSKIADELAINMTRQKRRKDPGYRTIEAKVDKTEPANTSQLPEEIQNIFDSAPYLETLTTTKEYIVSQLQRLGYVCKQSFTIMDNSIFHRTRVGIMASLSSIILAIEIDKSNPRRKSINQLLHIQDVIRIIILRNPRKCIQIKGIHYISQPKKRGVWNLLRGS